MSVKDELVREIAADEKRRNLVLEFERIAQQRVAQLGYRFVAFVKETHVDGAAFTFVAVNTPYFTGCVPAMFCHASGLELLQHAANLDALIYARVREAIGMYRLKFGEVEGNA